MRRPPTLILMCGLPGAGKTTLAPKPAHARRAVRLAPDEWLDGLDIDLWDGPARESELTVLRMTTRRLENDDSPC
jgi:predicted kinase